MSRLDSRLRGNDKINIERLVVGISGRLDIDDPLDPLIRQTVVWQRVGHDGGQFSAKIDGVLGLLEHALEELDREAEPIVVAADVGAGRLVDRLVVAAGAAEHAAQFLGDDGLVFGLQVGVRVGAQVGNMVMAGAVELGVVASE